MTRSDCTALIYNIIHDTDDIMKFMRLNEYVNIRMSTPADVALIASNINFYGFSILQPHLTSYVLLLERFASGLVLQKRNKRLGGTYYPFSS